MADAMNELWVTSHLLLWITTILEALLIVSLMRQVGSLLLRVGAAHPFDAGTGPKIGESAPWVPDPERLADERDDTRPILIAFLSTSCSACDDLVPSLNAVSSTYSTHAKVVAVVRESDSKIEHWRRSRHLKVPVVSSTEAFSRYSISGTPYAFVLDEERLVAARGGVNHIDHLESLLRHCVASTDDSDTSGQELN